MISASNTPAPAAGVGDGIVILRPQAADLGCTPPSDR